MDWHTYDFLPYQVLLNEMTHIVFGVERAESVYRGQRQDHLSGLLISVVTILQKLIKFLK